MTDDRAPALDLLRKNGSLILRIHLINQPTRTHRIVFGVQATPVKPLSEGWRRWSFYAQYPDTQRMIILGACYYWGAASPYSDVYPRKRDFSIFGKFREARQTGKQDWGFVEEWLRGYDDASQMDRYRASVACAMMCMLPNVRIIPYTNLRGGCAEEAGLVPLVLGGVVTQNAKEKLRLSRTEFALAALHEIKIWADGHTVGLEKAHQALFEFGYGLPDCEVFPY